MAGISVVAPKNPYQSISNYDFTHKEHQIQNKIFFSSELEDLPNL